jgi:hypothetical protein
MTDTRFLPTTELAAADQEYIRSNFVPLDELAGDRAAAVRVLVASRRYPQPAYVLDDGTEMVAADYLEPLDAAGGDPGEVRTTFLARYASAGGDEPHAEVWSDWLTGLYAVCLNTATPEAIARKGALVDGIDRLIAERRPRDPQWRTALREAVDELDGLERPFAPLDALRLGKPPTRQRLIDWPRERWPWLEKAAAQRTAA